MRLRDAGSVEQVFEGAHSGPVKVEDFVQGGHVVYDSPKARSLSCCSRLL